MILKKFGIVVYRLCRFFVCGSVRQGELTDAVIDDPNPLNSAAIHLFCCNGCPQFCHSLLQGVLLGFVVGSHLGKPLIADFFLQIILIKPLDDFVQLADALGLSSSHMEDLYTAAYRTHPLP